MLNNNQVETNTKRKILLVEDDHSQARLIQLIFAQSELDAELQLVHCLADAREILAKTFFDLVVTDLNLPDGQGIELLPEDPSEITCPIVLLTGQGDQEIAVQAIKAGAFDYIVKSEDSIKSLPNRVSKNLREWGNLMLRREMEEVLREKQAELEDQHKQLQDLFQMVSAGKREWELTFDCVNELIIRVDDSGLIRRANRAAVDYVQCSYNEICSKNISEVFGDLALLEQEQRGVEFSDERSGRVFLISSYDLSETEIGPGMVITAHDYTAISELNAQLAQSNAALENKRRELQQAYEELKQTQEQVLRQEKMATVGQLAAGVAHEINNPMGFILSNLGTLAKYLEKLKSYIEKQDQLIEDSSTKEAVATSMEFKKSMNIAYILNDLDDLVSESTEGAERVRKIVTDLKGFSHQTEENDQITDINQLIEDIIPIVWNEIKYKATLDKNYGDIVDVLCRPRLLGQVIINLLVNAVHAIDKQGVIKLTTSLRDDSVVIAISDNGCGMPADIVKRIFDPFFTTKEVGVGTGLGLSISYDIIKQHGGEMFVDSKVGEGTTFTIVLPKAGEDRETVDDKTDLTDSSQQQKAGANSYE